MESSIGTSAARGRDLYQERICLGSLSSLFQVKKGNQGKELRNVKGIKLHVSYSC